MFASMALALAAALSCTPEPQSADANGWWCRRLAEKGKLVEAGGSKVVFLGDSITHFFETGGSGAGKTVWDKYWAKEPYKALNLGFSADRTEHLLWRITEGRQLDGYAAKAIVLMIGTNNTGQRGDPAADTICGVKRILEVIREKQPQAKTVLCAILPNGEKTCAARKRNAAVNRELQKYADGRHVVWCDFTDRFLLTDGTIPRDMMPDLLHPREEGYYAWTAAVMPIVNAILKDDGYPVASAYPSRPCVKAMNPEEPRAALRPLTRICQPSWRGTDWWGDRLARNRGIIRESKGKVDLVLAGDSITHFWEDYGGRAYAALTNGITALNIGYGGDQTQNLLWRMRNGELDGYVAKRVMLMIGTNNNGIKGYDPAETAAGVKACLDVVREKQPTARVILCGYLPRAVGTKDGDVTKDGADARNRKTNELIRKFADGKSVIWLDMYDKFVVDGKIPKELMGDFIHPTEKGYEIWAESLKRVW